MPTPNPSAGALAPTEVPKTEAAAAKSSSTMSQTADAVLDLLRHRKNFRGIALVLSLIVFVASFAVVWYCWFGLIPAVWNWGFVFGWQAIPAFVALIFLATLPIYAPVGTALIVTRIVGLYAEEADSEVSDAVGRASTAQREAEKYLQQELGENGKSGLVPLMGYSRVQLESYYEIGLTQTQRSFRYSVIAMWIGFFLIVSGIAYQVFPFQQFGIPEAKTDLAFVSIAGGAIIEVISALFLWVYRSSIVQLTYFYNRQIYNHGVLMAYLIAQTMENGDDTKKLIIEKMLSQNWAIARPDAPSSAGIKNLVSKGGG